jgi:hypothetical protein
MGSKRSLPWSSSIPPSQENGSSIKRQKSSQSSQSSQPLSSWNSRDQPIVIDDSTDDDELYEEIFSTPLQPELDNYLSIGYIGTTR